MGTLEGSCADALGLQKACGSGSTAARASCAPRSSTGSSSEAREGSARRNSTFPGLAVGPLDRLEVAADHAAGIVGPRGEFGNQEAATLHASAELQSVLVPDVHVRRAHQPNGAGSGLVTTEVPGPHEVRERSHCLPPS